MNTLCAQLAERLAIIAPVFIGAMCALLPAGG